MVTAKLGTSRKNQNGCLKSTSGNTLAEYGLIGTGVLVACVAGFMLLGSGINQFAGKVKHDMRSKRTSAISVTAYMKEHPEIRNLGPLTSVDMDLLQEPLAQRTQTAGANGTVTTLTRQLAYIARKQLANGEIDGTQYQQLMDLANQGHKMASFQKIVADTLASCGGDPNACKNKILPYNGKEYNFTDVYTSLGYNGSSMPKNFLQSNPDNSGGELRAYLMRYQLALKSGGLDSPEAKATVDSASIQISMASDAFQKTLLEFAKGKIDLENTSELNKELGNNLKDKEIHADSGKICTAGDFEDDGVTCRK